ncbi:hypothetical protein [Vibrio splendidus]|uniref:capsular polysaccharide export protein, LipB/KpsS family n=1 Tax=Vibrio splendidus TaxID=29497 RepID=UPI0034A0B2D0
MKILSHISSKEDYDFIQKFKCSFEKNNIECRYLATNIETWIRLKAYSEDVSYVKNIKKSKGYENSFNVKVGYLRSSEDAGKTYYSYLKWLNDNYELERWELLIIPSGRMISHQAFTDFAKEHSIKTIYIGYGNFPGKTILDSIGTDKKSSLYLNPEILDDPYVDEDEYLSWKRNYIAEKEKNVAIPQARDINLSFIGKRFLRTIVCKIDNIVGVAHDIDYCFRDLDIGKFLFSKKVELNFTKIQEITDSYAFFAMQLSTDTQMIQNYEHDVYHALNVAIETAKKQNIKLMVKPHPAEVSIEIAKHLNQLEKSGAINLTNCNTISIIKGSKFVMVVNSTVGLEAKILNKKVIFFGETFFDHLDGKRVRSYLLHYLYNINYFSPESVSLLEFEKIKKRLF